MIFVQFSEKVKAKPTLIVGNNPIFINSAFNMRLLMSYGHRLIKKRFFHEVFRLGYISDK